MLDARPVQNLMALDRTGLLHKPLLASPLQAFGKPLSYMDLKSDRILGPFIYESWVFIVLDGASVHPNAWASWPLVRVLADIVCA